MLSQYYEDDRGNEPSVNRGAKVVADYQLPRAVTNTASKKAPEFNELVQQIRMQGFDPSFRRHVQDFDLRHPDSFRTLTADERQVKKPDAVQRASQ